MNSTILLDTQVKYSLERVAQEAPGDYKGLDTLGNHKLMMMLTHPDDVKIIKPIPFNYLDLIEVDQNGYQVYDASFTEIYRVIIDPAAPPVNLNVPGVKQMRFGHALLDTSFVSRLSHGDIFYIGYSSLEKGPRTIMCVYMDPTQVPV